MSGPRHTGRARRYALGILAVLLAVVVVVFAWIRFAPGPTDFAGGKHVALAAYRDSDPTGVPSELKSASLAERGEYLTRAADCVVCHTAKDGAPFAGGRAFVLPFGTLYSTNITPDEQTGIGRYTDKNFLDAVHKGIGRDGTALYPAMPYSSYTYMSDADALAIKAFLFTLKPLHAPAPQNTFIFPFNQRALLWVWSGLFNADKRFEPTVERSPEWNRGAYLVEAMEHCGECHTPRNLALALNNRKKFSGETQAGWRAYNITSHPTSGVGTWTETQLRDYLATGHADGRGTAAGPMGEAVDESMRHLTAADISAMVTYLRSTPGIVTADLDSPRQKPAPDQHAEGVSPDFAASGKHVFEGSCTGCHGWSGVSPGIPFASLTGSRAVNDPTATNVAQVILGGARRYSGVDTVTMPAFGEAYSDAEIASLANYVTARFGDKASQLSAATIAKMREK
jgi:mono/diheme cytochrome c family protein